MFEGYNLLSLEERVVLLSLSVTAIQGGISESDWSPSGEVRRFSGFSDSEFWGIVKSLVGKKLIRESELPGSIVQKKLSLAGKGRSLQLMITTNTRVQVQTRQMPDE